MTAFVLGLPEHKVRVIAPDVGGGFGSKIYLYAEETVHHLGIEAAEPPDQVDRRALRILPLGRARPRPRDEGRAGARQERQVPRDARDDHRQHGRVSLHLRLVHPDHPLRHAAGGPVHDAGDLLRGHGGVHQHRAGGRLSRRRPPGSDLRRRAAGRNRRARDEDRPAPRSAGATSSRSSRTRRRSRCSTTPATTRRRSPRR